MMSMGPVTVLVAGLGVTVGAVSTVERTATSELLVEFTRLEGQGQRTNQGTQSNMKKKVHDGLLSRI